MVTSFEAVLSGGHPNSLGNTVSVVDTILGDESQLDALIRTYESSDPVVRLRVSNALKRVCGVEPQWVYARLGEIEHWVEELEQPSAQWTLAHLYSALSDRLTLRQREKAILILQGFATRGTDWIVLNFSLQTLSEWAATDENLRAWLMPVLEKHSGDSRKSVANRAAKLLRSLTA